MVRLGRAEEFFQLTHHGGLKKTILTNLIHHRGPIQSYSIHVDRVELDLNHGLDNFFNYYCYY